MSYYVSECSKKLKILLPRQHDVTSEEFKNKNNIYYNQIKASELVPNTLGLFASRDYTIHHEIIIPINFWVLTSDEYKSCPFHCFTALQTPSLVDYNNSGQSYVLIGKPNEPASIINGCYGNVKKNEVNVALCVDNKCLQNNKFHDGYLSVGVATEIQLGEELILNYGDEFWIDVDKKYCNGCLFYDCKNNFNCTSGSFCFININRQIFNIGLASNNINAAIINTNNILLPERVFNSLSKCCRVNLLYSQCDELLLTKLSKLQYHYQNQENHDNILNCFVTNKPFVIGTDFKYNKKYNEIINMNNIKNNITINFSNTDNTEFLIYNNNNINISLFPSFIQKYESDNQNIFPLKSRNHTLYYYYNSGFKFTSYKYGSRMYCLKGKLLIVFIRALEAIQFGLDCNNNINNESNLIQNFNNFNYYLNFQTFNFIILNEGDIFTCPSNYLIATQNINNNDLTITLTSNYSNIICLLNEFYYQTCLNNLFKHYYSLNNYIDFSKDDFIFLLLFFQSNIKYMSEALLSDQKIIIKKFMHYFNYIFNNLIEHSKLFRDNNIEFINFIKQSSLIQTIITYNKNKNSLIIELHNFWLHMYSQIESLLLLLYKGKIDTAINTDEIQTNFDIKLDMCKTLFCLLQLDFCNNKSDTNNNHHIVHQQISKLIFTFRETINNSLTTIESNRKKYKSPSTLPEFDQLQLKVAYCNIGYFICTINDIDEQFFIDMIIKKVNNYSITKFEEINCCLFYFYQLTLLSKSTSIEQKLLIEFQNIENKITESIGQIQHRLQINNIFNLFYLLSDIILYQIHYDFSKLNEGTVIYSYHCYKTFKELFIHFQQELFEEKNIKIDLILKIFSILQYDKELSNQIKSLISKYIQIDNLKNTFNSFTSQHKKSKEISQINLFINFSLFFCSSLNVK
jgi:hypothetical protein